MYNKRVEMVEEVMFPSKTLLRLVHKNELILIPGIDEEGICEMTYYVIRSEIIRELYKISSFMDYHEDFEIDNEEETRRTILDNIVLFDNSIYCIKLPIEITIRSLSEIAYSKYKVSVTPNLDKKSDSSLNIIPLYADVKVNESCYLS